MMIPAQLSMKVTAETFLELFRAQHQTQGILYSLAEGSQAQQLLRLELSARQRTRFIDRLQASDSVACYRPNCWGFRVPFRTYLLHITLEIEATDQPVVCRAFGRVASAESE